MNFLHFYHPNQIFIQIGPIAIHWYGLILALTMIAAVAISLYSVKRRGLKTDDLLDLALWVVIAGIIGARLYDVFIIDWAYFSHNLEKIFYIWQGGLAIHGGIIGGVLALYFWCRYRKQDIWQWLDIIAVALPLAQAIGRWGNYFNQELFGYPTDLPWGIPIAENLRPLIFKTYEYFQPAFLYESILNLILFVILFWQFKKNQLKIGQAAGLYLVGYGLIRFAMEFVRIDATAVLFGVRVPQLASILLTLIGVTVFYYNKKRRVS